MKKKILSILFLIGFSCGLFAHEFEISHISSHDLSKQKELFITFWQEMYDRDGKEIDLDDVSREFENDQEAYEQESEDGFFIQATLMDQVVGYMSFELRDFEKVFIHKFVVHPAISDQTLIKALILSIFDYVPQCSVIRVNPETLFFEFAQVLEELGFVKTIHIEETYDLIVHDRCKICDMKYGSEFWDIAEEEPDEDDVE
jgi:hypothetical protein